MIVVNVEGYCQSCLDFTPDVIPPTKTWSDEKKEFILGDTVIKCKYHKRCSGIKRYLEQQAKGEVSG